MSRIAVAVVVGVAIIGVLRKTFINSVVAVIIDAVANLAYTRMNGRIRVIQIKVIVNIPRRSIAGLNRNSRIAVVVAVGVAIIGILLKPFINCAVAVIIDAVAYFR